jgi:hypothetical protein
MMQKKRRTLAIAIGATVLLSLALGAIYVDRFLPIRIDLGGSRFLGAGSAELDLRLFDAAPFKIQSSSLKPIPIYLLQAGTDSKSWHFTFNQIPIASASLPATAAFSVHRTRPGADAWDPDRRLLARSEDGG